MILFYFFLSMSRFLALLATWPLFKLIDANYTFKELIVIGWCHIIGPLQMIIMMQIFCHRLTFYNCDVIYSLLMVNYIMTNLFNGTTIPYVYRILDDKNVLHFNVNNMDNCLTHLLEVASYKIEAIKKEQGLTAFTLFSALLQFIVIMVFFFDGESIITTVFCILYIILRVQRLIIFFLYLFWFGDVIPGVSQFVEFQLDNDLVFMYTLGNAFIRGQSELLEVLDNIVNDPMLEKNIRAQVVRDRMDILKKMGYLMLDKPWVNVTVNTKQVICMVLGSTKHDIDEMKTSGRIDEYEHDKLIKSLENQIRSVLNYQKSIRPPSATELIESIPWMDSITPETKKYLLEKLEIRLLSPGEILYTEGDKAIGVFVASTGVIKITYALTELTKEDLQKYGQLPVVESIPSINLETPFEQYIINGHSFGEMGVVTKRKYNCTIIGDTQCHCYVLPVECFKYIFEMYPGPQKK
ncbi:unnamed protein product [Brassicogethes aeneus]|uniref:Cyclic nucleotide-binding domain-containing protein n=1 Tax=Brassicogethes aeneus TaxID=1431903 RepID=A0A9P0AYK7_BRAAE|nr:unnamed protein product [Brassicogethes aeneus]